MSLIRINPQPSARDLRVFATLWLVFLGAAGAIAWHKGAESAAFAWGAGAVSVAAPGLIAPRRVRLVYLAATYAAFPVGFVMSATILAAFYFLALTPAGVIMRMLGRDSLDRRFAPHRATYWEPRGPPPAPDSYFRQYP